MFVLIFAPLAPQALLWSHHFFLGQYTPLPNFQTLYMYAHPIIIYAHYASRCIPPAYCVSQLLTLDIYTPFLPFLGSVFVQLKVRRILEEDSKVGRYYISGTVPSVLVPGLVLVSHAERQVKR